MELGAVLSLPTLSQSNGTETVIRHMSNTFESDLGKTTSIVHRDK